MSSSFKLAFFTFCQAANSAPLFAALTSNLSTEFAFAQIKLLRIFGYFLSTNSKISFIKITLLLLLATISLTAHSIEEIKKVKK